MQFLLSENMSIKHLFNQVLQNEIIYLNKINWKGFTLKINWKEYLLNQNTAVHTILYYNELAEVICFQPIQ